MLNTLIKLCLVVIPAGVLLHGYFYIQYGSPHPCVAAQAKMIKTGAWGKGLFSQMVHIDGSNPIACYRYVLIGSAEMVQQ